MERDVQQGECANRGFAGQRQAPHGGLLDHDFVPPVRGRSSIPVANAIARGRVPVGRRLLDLGQLDRGRLLGTEDDSLLAPLPWISASSGRVGIASGGGGSRSSRPELSTHVFHVPALGSTSEVCASASPPLPRSAGAAIAIAINATLIDPMTGPPSRHRYTGARFEDR
jgi:hypothetical protein